MFLASDVKNAKSNWRLLPLLDESIFLDTESPKERCSCRVPLKRTTWAPSKKTTMQIHRMGWTCLTVPLQPTPNKMPSDPHNWGYAPCWQGNSTGALENTSGCLCLADPAQLPQRRCFWLSLKTAKTRGCRAKTSLAQPK